MIRMTHLRMGCVATLACACRLAIARRGGFDERVMVSPAEAGTSRAGKPGTGFPLLLGALGDLLLDVGVMRL